MEKVGASRRRQHAGSRLGVLESADAHRTGDLAGPVMTCCSVAPFIWKYKVAWLAPLTASRSSRPTVTSARSVRMTSIPPL
jgi:hypothetical protein